MNDVESVIRATLESTPDVRATITGVAVRRLARRRRHRTQVGGAAVLASAMAAVAVMPQVFDRTPTGGSGVGTQPSASTSAAPSESLGFTRPAVPVAPPTEAPVTKASAAVFDDVVAGAFPMPGVTARRTIRVMHMARSIANVACGGAVDPNLDDTSERYNQARYAALDLIAEKGLVEQSSDSQFVGRVDVGACDDKTLPSYVEWSGLAGEWDSVAAAAIASPRVKATRPEVAACAAKYVGKTKVDPADPVSALLNDGHFQQFSGSAYRSEMKRISDAFVECTAPYFAAVEAELAPQRVLQVAQHRELLQRFADELAAAGYLP